MNKKPKSMLEQVKEDVANGTYPEKLQKTKKNTNILAIFLFILLIGTLVSFWAYATYGGSLFDENMTHRSCDFLSIEGMPILVRCSDGTYWDASKHIDGQSSSAEEILPVEMVVKPTPPPFLFQKVDTSKL